MGILNILLVIYLPIVIVDCCPAPCTCWNDDKNVACTKSDNATTHQIQETVKMLDLSNTGLNSVPVVNLQHLKELEILNLSDNKIKDVPSNLSSYFPMLRTLHLDGNQFEVINSLPGLQKIKVLDLGGNKIRTIVPFAFSALNNLKVLRLPRNRITTIPPKAFYGLFELTWLDLSGNGLNEIDGDTFRWPRSKLRSLILNDNNLESISDGTFAATKELEVYLRNNSIKKISNKAFHETTRVVDLQYNDLVTLPVSVFEDMTDATIDVRGNSLECKCDLVDDLRRDLSAKNDKLIIGNCSADGFPDDMLTLCTPKSNYKEETMKTWMWVIVVFSGIVFVLMIVSIVIVLCEMRRLRYSRSRTSIDM